MLLLHGSRCDSNSSYHTSHNTSPFSCPKRNCCSCFDLFCFCWHAYCSVSLIKLCSIACDKRNRYGWLAFTHGFSFIFTLQLSFSPIYVLFAFVQTQMVLRMDNRHMWNVECLMCMCRWHGMLVFYCFTILFFTHDGNQTKIHTDKPPIIILLLCKMFQFTLSMLGLIYGSIVHWTMADDIHFISNSMKILCKCIRLSSAYHFSFVMITESIIVMWLSEYNRIELKWNEMDIINTVAAALNFRLCIRKFCAQMTSMKVIVAINNGWMPFVEFICSKTIDWQTFRYEQICDVLNWHLCYFYFYF